MRKIGPLLVLLGISHVCVAVPTSTEVSYRGVLVAEPCAILPGDESIELDFGTVVDKYLYLNQRTVAKPFEIRLADCDLNLGARVSVSFSGPASPSLTGLLALSPGSQANGIAIGIATADGKPLPLNQSTTQYGLVAGGNLLRLQAYVQGEPEALANKSITLGAFSAVATFVLSYE